MIFTTPIVGAFFRRPAKAIISNLPSGAPLLLEAEPDNPYSKNGCAIKVLIKSSDIPRNEDSETACAAQGFPPETVWEENDVWHIAYVDETKTGNNAKIFDVLDKVISVKLSFDFKGNPLAEVEFPEGTEL